jgi:hypothetical protein
MIEVKCLKCGGVLFKKVFLDDKGHMAMDMNAKIDLESDGVDHFFRCPHWQAKNVVLDTTSPHGLPQIRISHTKE